ncbi:MAG TPA: helix-hairpin-helix domain-containing protein [Ohtaekwangia sp.]|uniref:ComEA family DNA-binding protein n=1 Tax=Ohtaekwangia sp. TaxID=2066019 RepID=UPI002F9429F0
MNRYLLTLFAMLCCRYMAAQEYPQPDIDLQRIVDDLYGVQDTDLNYEDLYENVAQLLARPLDLNSATAEELRFCKILSEDQIRSLIDYRETTGGFLSVYELQAIPGLELSVIYRLMPFVKVYDPASRLHTSIFSRIRNESDNYFITRYERTLQSSQGYKAETPAGDRFKGSQDKLCMRFRCSRPGDFSFGFSAKKDAGEQLTWNPVNKQYGFDYISFHAQLQNKGRLKNLVLGDFQSQFGQGLMIGGIFGMGKGGETITTTRRSNIGHLPYTSFTETGNLHGLAATIEVYRHIYTSFFYSSTSRDAAIADGEDDLSIITSLPSTGLHRNTGELAHRRQTGEQRSGAILHYKNERFDAGILYNRMELSHPVLKTATLYNQFAFQGNTSEQAGIYLNYTWQNVTFFSEAATSDRHGHAYIAGLLGSLTRHLDIALLHRNYSCSYHASYSNAFAEGSTTQNESGTYWGWKYTFSRRLAVAGYLDLFQFPWLKYRIYAPSTGQEWLTRLQYQPSRKVILFAQLREEVKSRNNAADTSTLYTQARGRKYNYWLQCDAGITSALRLKTRLQGSSYSIDNHTTRGIALIQDISIRIARWEITARYALFDTDDYDNRQYVYENDVWLAFSLPAYYGEGMRKYILLEYKLNEYISFWLRYAYTRYNDRTSIGAGVDQIDGNIRSDVKLQARVKF